LSHTILLAIVAKVSISTTLYAHLLTWISLDAIRGKLMVEIEGFDSFVNLAFKNLPKFCINYQIVGQSTAHCRKNHQVTKNEKS